MLKNSQVLNVSLGQAFKSENLNYFLLYLHFQVNDNVEAVCFQHDIVPVLTLKQSIIRAVQVRQYLQEIGLVLIRRKRELL